MRLGQYTTDRGRCCSETCRRHTAQRYHPNLRPDAWENSLRRLSDRAQAVFHAVITWAHQLPAGTVDVTCRLFPPEDDFGSELLITLRPYAPSGGVLTIGVISDTTVPFHVHLGNVHDLVTATGLTRSL
jgi:hypothetical protein